MWSDAIAAVAELTSRLLRRLWGARTKEDDAVEQELRTAQTTFNDAIRRGDARAASDVYRRLRELRDKAVARRLGR